VFKFSFTIQRVNEDKLEVLGSRVSLRYSSMRSAYSVQNVSLDVVWFGFG